MRCRLVVQVLLVVQLASACNGTSGAGDIPSTTVPAPTVTTTTSPPTTTAADPFAVPAVIDLPYVQRVLEAIYHLGGDAARHIYAKKLPDAEFEARLDAIFADESLKVTKRVLQENAAEGFVRFADPPGDAKVTATEVVQATPRCIVVRASLDFNPLYKRPVPAEPEGVIQLARFERSPFNPTGWGVLVAGDPDPGQDLKVCS